MFEPFRDEEGRCSYELLAEQTQALPRDGRVLDIGCGDGYLLALLAKQGFRQLVGVDRSPSELAAARERLGPEVELHCQDARTLPLPSHSVDMAVCHMALMVMDSPDAVLAEVARILRPGAFFVAAINRAFPDPAWQLFRRERIRATSESGLGTLRLGNPKIYTEQGMRELLREQSFDAEHLVLQDLVVRTRATPLQLWSMYEPMYDVFRLPMSSREELLQRVIVAWEPLIEEDGQLTADMGIRLIRCPSRK